MDSNTPVTNGTIQATNSQVSMATPNPVAVQPTQVTSIASQVNARVAQTLPPAVLAKLNAAKGNTKDITSPYFHCLLYGEIDAGKTVCAAQFDSPEKVRIIMTRRPEQLMSLRDLNYQYIHASSIEIFRNAVMYPEVIWPDWAKLSDRTLVIDDITQAKDMLNDDNEFTETGQEIKDFRRISKNSKDDFRSMLQLNALNKPMNLILVAQQKQWEQGREIKINPDLPTGLLGMISADFEAVFNIRKTGQNKRELITDTDREMCTRKDDKGKEQTYQIVTFARHKISKNLAGKVIKSKEPAELRAVWEKLKSGVA